MRFFNFFSRGPYTRWNVLNVSISPEIIGSVAILFTMVCLALSCAQSRPYRIADTWITLTYRFERVTLHPDTVLSQRYPVANVSAITMAVRHFIVPTSRRCLRPIGLCHQAGKYMKHAGLERNILRRRLSAILKGVTFTSADNLENYFYRSLSAPIVVSTSYLKFCYKCVLMRFLPARLDVYTNILQLIQISVI